MRTPPTIRLQLLVARAAPRILIIRRGPTRTHHLALWHTDTDIVEHGSWFRGQLYVERSDLSWDGQWLVYFALGPTREYYSWTAVARPPWVRAELFYPDTSTWTGGGLWVEPDRLWLNSVGPARPEDPAPAELGFQVIADAPLVRRHITPLYARLERDGWRRDDPPGTAYDRERAQSWIRSGGPEWALQAAPELPALRMRYGGYDGRVGQLFSYQLIGYPGLLDAQVSWAGYDSQGRLVVARGAAVERYTLADLARGAPSFRYDLGGLTPPPPPPRPHPTAAPPPLAQLGPDALGRYHFLGEPGRRRAAEGRAGQPIRSQDDLRAIAPILREDAGQPFDRPQIYIVTTEGGFVLGGRLGEDVDAAGGQPTLAAGEAVLEERPDGTWAIGALNNRSYGYMPGPESWGAVARALRATGIPHPADGFSEVYPLEGTWEEILAALRA